MLSKGGEQFNAKDLLKASCHQYCYIFATSLKLYTLFLHLRMMIRNNAIRQQSNNNNNNNNNDDDDDNDDNDDDDDDDHDDDDLMIHLVPS